MRRYGSLEINDRLSTEAADLAAESPIPLVIDDTEEDLARSAASANISCSRLGKGGQGHRDVPPLGRSGQGWQETGDGVLLVVLAGTAGSAGQVWQEPGDGVLLVVLVVLVVLLC